MEIQTPDRAAAAYAARIADEVRVELARQRRTAGDLASALGVTAHTIGRRLNAEVPFSTVELIVAAEWLGVEITELIRRAKNGMEAAA